MKKVAIHQPHYFPWLGYLDKMAKVDEFIIMDEVQLTDRSPMVRNKFLQANGASILLSVSVDKKGYRDKKTCEIRLSDWEKVSAKHKTFFELNYRKCVGYDEVMALVEPVLTDSYERLIDVEMASMNALRAIFDIHTPLIFQSQISTGDMGKNNDLILNLCINDHADAYLSGNGARKYMVDDKFLEKGIKVSYQKFQYPIYEQRSSEEFVPNLSALDLAFQYGIDRARDVFCSNMQMED